MFPRERQHCDEQRGNRETEQDRFHSFSRMLTVLYSLGGANQTMTKRILHVDIFRSESACFVLLLAGHILSF